MNTIFTKIKKQTSKLTLGLALGTVISTPALAQSGSLRGEFPELANLYNAFDVTQAGIYDAIADINGNPASQDGRMELKMHLDMMAEMDHGGHGGGMAAMDMGGGYMNLKIKKYTQCVDIGVSL